MSDTRIDNIEKNVKKISDNISGIFIGSVIISSIAAMFGGDFLLDGFSENSKDSLKSTKENQEILIEQNAKIIELLQNNKTSIDEQSNEGAAFEIPQAPQGQTHNPQ